MADPLTCSDITSPKTTTDDGVEVAFHSFLELPRELRQMVYECYLAPTTFIYTHQPPASFLHLRLTSKQVADESLWTIADKRFIMPGAFELETAFDPWGSVFPPFFGIIQHLDLGFGLHDPERFDMFRELSNSFENLRSLRIACLSISDWWWGRDQGRPKPMTEPSLLRWPGLEDIQLVAVTHCIYLERFEAQMPEWAARFLAEAGFCPQINDANRLDKICGFEVYQMVCFPDNEHHRRRPMTQDMVNQIMAYSRPRSPAEDNEAETVES